MGIQVEFNPDLALRAFGTPGRLEEECLPNKLIAGNVHRFQKDGQRVYWLEGEIPLLETKGNQKLSRPSKKLSCLSMEFLGCSEKSEVAKQLLRTKVRSLISLTLASIVIREYTHLKVKDKTYTTGLYEIKEVYNSNNPAIHFEGMNKIT